MMYPKRLGRTGTRGDPDLIHLVSPSGTGIGQAFLRLVGRPLEKLLQIDRVNAIYRTCQEIEDCRLFAEGVLREMDATWEPPTDEWARIPSSGPVIIAANHPFGAIEGLVLLALLARLRPDSKVMANYLLMRVPQLRPMVIPVDPFGSAGATRRNIAPTKEAISWLKQGNCLGMFPAGAVSHFQVGRREVSDPSWNPLLGRLVELTGATVVPVYFGGANGLMFQLAGLLHPRFRTALLARELANKRKRKLVVRIGTPLSAAKLRSRGDARAITEYLRMRTYLLADRSVVPIHAASIGAEPAQIIPPIPPDLLERELSALPHECRLVDHDDYLAVVAGAEQIPRALKEIGRLREITFRAVGEGTGNAVDLDRFDNSYLHLFVWNKEKREIVGAYRLGRTDQIIAREGVKGLYTRTLFRFSHSLIRQLTPAIELGRSFVRQEYQRDFLPLNMLWRGVGEFVVRHPQYRYLFGPVSISNDFGAASRQLLVSFLKANNYDLGLARFVKARTPLKNRHRLSCSTRLVKGKLVPDLDEVASLITELESEKTVVPVLLRHYLRLGGRMVGFNVDRQFSDALDGLIVVDLLAAPSNVIERYFGKPGYHSYRTHWSHQVTNAQPYIRSKRKVSQA